MKTLLYFVLAFCCAGLVPAQERVIDKTQFEAAVAGGYDHRNKWKGEKYRLAVTTSSTMAGRPQTDWSSKTITEYGLSGETRSIYTSAFGGKPAVPKESVRIGEWVYTRSGNDAWTRKEYVASNPSAPEKEEIPRKLLSSEVEYKYLGPSTLSGRSVQIYSKIERRKSLNEKNGETSESESKNTYWIDGKGLILKTEFASEHRGKNTMQTGVLMEWELDPSITFKVPEIVP